MSELNSQPAPGPSPRLSGPGVSARALIVGLVLVPVNVYWVIQMERNRQTAFPTVFSLFFNAVFILLVLRGVNLAVRRIRPRLAFDPSELLVVYSMVCISTAISGIDFIQTLMPLLSYSFWMAGPENKWEDILNPHLPKWLTVQDRDILKGYYEGGGSLYEPGVFSAWLAPVLMWTAFIALLLLVMLCLNVLFRRRWLDGEHLACPLVSLPLEIAAPRARLFRSRIFWLGFGLAAGIEIWNSVSFYYPAVPIIPIVEQDIGRYFRGRPWNAVGWMPRSFYPFLIGLGYQMPQDFLFSCWFFYLFWKAELVMSAFMGLDQIRGFPFANQQGFGAYLLFAAYGVWLGRDYFRQVWDTIIRAPAHLRDDGEPMPYRLAALGIIAGLIGLVWFSIALGMRPVTAFAVFGIYYVLSLAITRVRVQFGTPVHDLHFTGPDVILSSVFGTRSFPTRDLTGMGLLSWFSSIFRSHPMPHQMEGIRLQEQTGGTTRGLSTALMLAGVVGSLAAFWTILHTYYGVGALAKGGRFNLWAFSSMDSWLKAPQGPQWAAGPAIGVGLGVAFFLQVMRMRYVSWPFHPLGYAISGNIQMNHAWMPLLTAWVLKASITKYGGHRAAHRSQAFFLGLILADFVVISLINIISIALHVPCYRFVD